MDHKHDFSSSASFNHSPWQLTNMDAWEAIFEGAPVKTLRKNTVVFHQGDPLQWIYFVRRGRVRSSVFDENGQEMTILIFTEGTIFGEVSAIEQSPYQVTTTTNTACTLAYLPVAAFLEKVEQSPALTRHLTRSLTQKIIRLASHIKDIALLNSDERVVAYLLKLADTFGVETERGVKIAITFTHQEMADLIATSRVTVSKVMSLLDKEGLLQRVDGYLYIKDKQSLLQWSASQER